MAVEEYTPVWRLGLPAGLALVLGWVIFRIIHFTPFAEFLIATEAEMNKVSWTSKDDLYRATTVVLATVVLMALFLFVVDWLWLFILRMIGVLHLYRRRRIRLDRMTLSISKDPAQPLSRPRPHPRAAFVSGDGQTLMLDPTMTDPHQIRLKKLLIPPRSRIDESSGEPKRGASGAAASARTAPDLDVEEETPARRPPRQAPKPPTRARRSFSCRR